MKKYTHLGFRRGEVEVVTTNGREPGVYETWIFGPDPTVVYQHGSQRLARVAHKKLVRKIQRNEGRLAGRKAPRPK